MYCEYIRILFQDYRLQNEVIFIQSPLLKGLNMLSFSMLLLLCSNLIKLNQDYFKGFLK